MRLFPSALYWQRRVLHPRISVPNSPACAGLWTVACTYFTMHKPCCSTFRFFCRYLKIEIYVVTQYNSTLGDIVFMLQIYNTTTNILFLLQSLSWLYIIFYINHPHATWSEMEMAIIIVIVFVWIPSVWDAIFLVGAKYPWVVAKYSASWSND